MSARIRRGRARGARRAFTLVEMLLALAISAAILAATVLALQASFRTYQATVEQASTHVVGRMVMQRTLTLIRTGVAFGPIPANPLDRFVQTDEFSITDAGGTVLTLRLDREEEQLLIRAGEGDERVLLDGARGPVDGESNPVGMFTLEYENGWILRRAHLDFTLLADDDATLSIEGDEMIPLRLVGTAAPRRAVW
jgi:prepilin-type N-terminal cleavage/methylation domain-containing protein